MMIFVCICVGGWILFGCVRDSGYEVLIGIDVYKIVGYFVQCAKSGLSPPLVQGWPGEGRGQGASRCLPAVTQLTNLRGYHVDATWRYRGYHVEAVTWKRRDFVESRLRRRHVFHPVYTTL